MSDEQKICYIEPDDDLTTVRERLEKIPSRKVTLVIDSQTQLRSHVAWKLLAARARELGKEVLIVSTDPQVRSIAHAVKFKVAHSSEASPNAWRPKSGSSTGTGRNNSGSSRRSVSSPAKEPTSKRGASRAPRNVRSPLSEQPPTWSESRSFTQPKPLDSQQSDLDDPHAVKPHETRPQRLNLPERNPPREERGRRHNQIFDFRSEAPPAIRPLPITHIEEPDQLFEDYNQAQNIRQAAAESRPDVQEPQESGRSSENVNTPISNIPTPQSHEPTSPIYGENDPFIYMQDDSQSPAQSEQKGEAILLDDEISQEYPSLQRSTISALPTNVIEEKRVEYSDDEDDRIPPITSPPFTQAGPRDIPINEEEKAEERPSGLPTRLYGAPSKDSRYDYTPPSGQTVNEEEDQLPAFTERPAPLPMPRTPSKPLMIPSKPLSSRTGGPMAPKTPSQKSATSSTTRNGPRISQTMRSRPASQTAQPRRDTARPSSTTGQTRRRSGARSPLRVPKRLLLILASIIALFAILFGVAYLTTTSTVQVAVATQDYPYTVKLVLSDKNASGTVDAKLKKNTFTKTAPEPATGTTIQPSGNATGKVSFENTGTASVRIPSHIIVATNNGVKFETTANALIPPQESRPVPIQARNQGVSGNVPAKSITVIPAESLTSIVQETQSPQVTEDSLKTTLTVSNPEATAQGDAHEVPAVTQTDLDNAKKDLDNQVQADIDAWVQQQGKNALVGQPVKTDDALTNPPTPDTPAPDSTFPASISVTVTALVAPVNDARDMIKDQLDKAVKADQKFGQAFTIVDPQTIKIDLTQQKPGDGNTVTVPTIGKVGPNLDIDDLKNSIKGKPLSDAQAIVRQKNNDIKKVDIYTQPAIFTWVSPWVDHITVPIQSASK